MPYRSCRVSFTDSEGIEDAASVSAASLYEAAASAIAEFRRCGFVESIFGAATRFTVLVKAPEEEHTVSMAKIRSWLDGGAKSPNEQVQKNRLRDLLAK